MCWPTILDASKLRLDGRFFSSEDRLTSLYEQALAGDDQAMQDLFSDLFPLIQKYIHKQTRLMGVSQIPPTGSIAHDVLLFLGDYLYEAKPAPQPFLGGIYYLAWERMWGDKRGRLEHLEEQLFNEDNKDLPSLVAELDPTYRTIWDLNRKGESWREIAKATGLPSRTVQAAIARLDRLVSQVREDYITGIRKRYLELVEELTEPRKSAMKLYLQGHSPRSIGSLTGLNYDCTLMLSRIEQSIRKKLADPLDIHRDLYKKWISRLPDRERGVLELSVQSKEPLEVSQLLDLEVTTVEYIYRHWRERFLAAISDLQGKSPADEERFLERALWPIGERRALEMAEENRSIAFISQQLGVGKAEVKKKITTARKRESEKLSATSEKNAFYMRVIPYMADPTRTVLTLSLEYTPKQIADRLSMTVSQVKNLLERYRRYLDDAYLNWEEKERSPEELRVALAMAQLGPVQRKALMRSLEGIPNTAIAVELDLTYRAAVVLVSQTRTQLEMALERQRGLEELRSESRQGAYAGSGTAR